MSTTIRLHDLREQVERQRAGTDGAKTVYPVAELALHDRRVVGRVLEVGVVRTDVRVSLQDASNLEVASIASPTEILEAIGRMPPRSCDRPTVAYLRTLGERDRLAIEVC